MKEKKKIILSIGIIVIVLIILSIIIVNVGKNKQNIATNIKTIKVNEVTRSVFYAPQYVAINNNFFKENGVDIELTTGQRSRRCYDSSTFKSM